MLCRCIVVSRLRDNVESGAIRPNCYATEKKEETICIGSGRTRLIDGQKKKQVEQVIAPGQAETVIYGLSIQREEFQLSARSKV